MHLILIILLFAGVSYGSDNEAPTCSKNGTVLMFINGIRVDSLDFKEFTAEITSLPLIRERVDIKGFETDFRYNISEGKNRDIAETLLLWYTTRFPNKNFLSSFAHKLISAMMSSKQAVVYAMCSSADPQTREICTGFKKLLAQKTISTQYTFVQLAEFRNAVTDYLKNDKKVILVTHSAGAMFADRIRDFVDQYYPQYAGLVSTVSIARPLSYGQRPDGTASYLTFDKDQLMNEMRAQGLPVPAGNLSLDQNCLPGTGEPEDLTYSNHAFSCYVSSNIVSGQNMFGEFKTQAAYKFVQDAIYQSATKLKNNDPKCCNMKPGRVWRNEQLCEDNLPNCYSGFVSENTKISNPTKVELINSYLCGAYTVSPGSNDSLKIEGSKLLGKGTLKSGHIVASTFEENSKADITKGKFNTVILKGSVKSYNEGEILQSTLEGMTEFGGSVTLENTTITSNSEASTFFGSGTISSSDLVGKFDFRDEYSIVGSNLADEMTIKGNVNLFEVEATGINSLNGRISITSVTKVRGGNEIEGDIHFNTPELKNLVYRETEASERMSVLTSSQWRGVLHINGIVNLNSMNLGEDVTVNGIAGPPTSNWDVVMNHGRIDNNLVVAETGIFRFCNFLRFGTGESDYIISCLEKNFFGKVFNL